MYNDQKKQLNYDLEERTAKFGEEIIQFAKKLPKDSINISLINQVVKSGTSIGANYLEANDSESDKDFIHKISISRKESHETKHWLRMLAAAIPEFRNEARKLWQEAKELNLIFSAIIKNKKEKGIEIKK
ncbi:MAG: four helix bundle protein [bacterium]